MNCACSISYDHDGSDLHLLNERFLIGKKKYSCSECNMDINPGEKFLFTQLVSKAGGTKQINTYTTCIDCYSLIKEFFDGWIFGEVWDDFENNLDNCDVVPESSISKLTPAARDAVCRIIEKSWRE